MLEHALYIMILFWDPDNLPQGYLKPTLVSSIKKFYGRHYQIVAIYMWHFRNMLNGDFPARLWITPIMTNLNGNMGDETSMAQDAYHHSRKPGLILGF